MTNRSGRGQSRARLLDAAERALVHRGPRGLRLRDVAETAGVTPPAVSYHFPDLDQLVVDVYRRATQRFVASRREAVVAHQDPAVQLRVLIDRGIPSGPEDEQARLTYQLASEATGSATYGTLSAALFESEVSLYVSVIDRGDVRGVFHPRASQLTVARTLVALEDALGLRVILDDPALPRDDAVEHVSRIASILLETPSPQPTS